MENVHMWLQDPCKCKEGNHWLTAVLGVFVCSPVSSFHIPPRLDQTENWCPCVHFTTTCSYCVERKPLLAWLSFRGNGERLHWDKVDPRCSQDCESIAVNILSWSRVRNGDTCDRVKSCHCLFHHGPEVCLFSSFFPIPVIPFGLQWPFGVSIT